MLVLGLVLLLLGLFLGSGLCVILGVVLLVLGAVGGVGGYGWWYPRRRGPY